MAWSKSDKRRYPSRYSDSHVTVAQYITEYLCEILAKKMNYDLPQRFWELEEWQKFYRYQVGLANKLLNEFHPRALVRALRDRRLAKLTSFVGLIKIPAFRAVVVEYHIAAVSEDDAQKNVEQTKAGPTTDKPKSPPSRQTTLGKLRNL